MMAAASGLLIYALVWTQYNDPLIQFEEVNANDAPQIPLSNISDLKFKLNTDQLNKMDCSILGPGTETFMMIENELWVFECPDDRYD